MDQSYVEDARKAGKIAALVLQYGASLIKPGVKYYDVYEQIVAFIKKHGAEPAFPPQMSFNAVAAHFLAHPLHDHVLSNEVVKLDVGVSVNGCIGDNATTVDLSGQHKKLVDASRAAVEAVRQKMHLGMTLNEIGTLIEKKINDQGFVPVRNLTGHGLDRHIIHTKPTIPNVPNHDMHKVSAGMHFACEPFATNGAGLIGDNGEAEVFSFITDGPVRDNDARKLLKFIKDNYGTLPFSTRDVLKLGLSYPKTRMSISSMVRIGVLHAYPPLVEKQSGMVSQAEHTFLVLPDGTIECTTWLG